MKKKVILCLGGVALLLSGIAIGYFNQPVYFISQNNFDSTEKWKLYDYDDENYFIGEIDIKPIAKALSNVHWTNKNTMTKGSYVLKRENQTIHLSYHANFYWISGKPGFYLITEKYQDEYKEFISKKIFNTVVEWRLSNNIKEDGQSSQSKL